jgi:hypothetical protein
VEQLQNDDDASQGGNVRRVEIIRRQIRKFYLEKAKYDLENAPSFFVSASEIVAQDEDALIALMMMIYGISILLKNNS